MILEASDIVALKATKELLEERIKKNKELFEYILYEHRSFDYACDDDWRGDEKREHQRLIYLYSEKLKMVEGQIEKKLLAIH